MVLGVKLHLVSDQLKTAVLGRLRKLQKTYRELFALFLKTGSVVYTCIMSIELRTY